MDEPHRHAGPLGAGLRADCHRRRCGYSGEPRRLISLGGSCKCARRDSFAWALVCSTMIDGCCTCSRRCHAYQGTPRRPRRSVSRLCVGFRHALRFEHHKNINCGLVKQITVGPAQVRWPGAARGPLFLTELHTDNRARRTRRAPRGRPRGAGGLARFRALKPVAVHSFVPTHALRSRVSRPREALR